jgi:hypothetical protein
VAVRDGRVEGGIDVSAGDRVDGDEELLRNEGMVKGRKGEMVSEGR